MNEPVPVVQFPARQPAAVWAAVTLLVGAALGENIELVDTNTLVTRLPPEDIVARLTQAADDLKQVDSARWTYAQRVAMNQRQEKVGIVVDLQKMREAPHRDPRVGGQGGPPAVRARSRRVDHGRRRGQGVRDDREA